MLNKQAAVFYHKQKASDFTPDKTCAVSLSNVQKDMPGKVCLNYNRVQKRMMLL